MLVADRLQHAGVGREAGLAAALARQAEALEQHGAELLGRPDDELVAGQVPDLALQAGDLLAHALVDGGQALRRRAARPRAPSRAARARAAARSRPARTAGSRSRICSRCQAVSAWTSTASRARRVLDVGLEPALLADLAEREAAPGGLQQVGAEQRVVGQDRRHRAQRLGVVGDRRPLADRPDELGRPDAQSPTSTSSPAASPKRGSCSGGSSSPSGTSGASTASEASVSRPPKVGASRTEPSRTRAADGGRRDRRGRRRVGARPAPPRGGAAGRAARTRGRRRAGASGRARGPPRARGRRPPSRRAGRWPGAWRRGRRRRAGRGSPCAWRPEIWSTLASTSSSEPNCCRSWDAVLSPMPGTPGMLSDVSPLSP